MEESGRVVQEPDENETKRRDEKKSGRTLWNRNGDIAALGQVSTR